MSYRLLSYQSGREARAGILVEDQVYDPEKIIGTLGYDSVLAILQDWRFASSSLALAAERIIVGKSRAKGVPLKRVKLLAPVLYPGNIYCAGANYTDHALEMAKLHNRPIEPDPHTQGLKAWHFIKASRALTDPGATVTASHYTQKLDWEVELAAVIGKPAKNVSVEKALDHVAGYTAANDLSARDLSRRPHVPDISAFKSDWIGQKSFDGACPLGPWIVPAQDIPDPQNLAIKLWVNGAIKQDSNTSKMIYSIAEQIAHLSSGMTLHPGDIVLTGTPAGVGSARNEYLKPGDVVKIEIERIGTLTNTIA